MKPAFDVVWQRIRAREGEAFKTITGLPFTYRMDGAGLITSRTDFRLAMSDMEKAFDAAPVSGPGKYGSLVRGQPYLWAILHDARIRRGDW